MKLKKLVSLITMLCLVAALLPSAFADSSDKDYFENRSWDEVVADYFKNQHINPDFVTLGYYNTVTGEEHFHQPDKYMLGASVYKVPLNMAYAEKISKGEMDWDSLTPYEPYEDLMRNSIIYSDNEDSGTLMFNLGGSYRGFLEYIAPYLGVDPETVDPLYYNEHFTARQFVTCLKTLYHDSKRFPKIIETMKEAEPNNYFRYSEKRYEIAQKYGYWPGDLFSSVNDVGIVFTDDPFVLVMFTSGVVSVEAMSDFCTLMCDYTQYHRTVRLAAEAAEAAEAARLQAALEDAAEDSKTRPLVSESLKAIPAEPDLEENGMSPLLIVIAILALAMLAIAAILIIAKHRRINVFWSSIAVVACACAALLCLLASSLGILYAKPKGDPQQTVSAFFQSLSSGDYDSAYSYISGYSSLGLENTPSDTVSETVYDALKASYSFALSGECSVEKLSATQAIQLSYLNLPSLREDVSTKCLEKLESIVMERKKTEVYDENDKFLPSVTAEAFGFAVNEVLKSAEKYCVTENINIKLEYKDGSWFIVPDTALINAISGGVAN